MNNKIVIEAGNLHPTAIIEMFILDATKLGGEILYFHPGSAADLGNISWQGHEYLRFPCKTEGFEFRGKGELPRPKIAFSNVHGTFTALTQNFQDLCGAKLTRKRTFRKFLTGPEHDATAEFPDDVYFIDRKSVETKTHVEFELASILEVEGILLPRRQIHANMCFWKYRSSECSYVGGPKGTIDDDPLYDEDLNSRGNWNKNDTYNTDDYVFEELEDGRRIYYVAKQNGLSGENDKPPHPNKWTTDECSKRVRGCKLRFGDHKRLPFGGFPGTHKLPL
jgi:lambda family phage minor tail protein L